MERIKQSIWGQERELRVEFDWAAASHAGIQALSLFLYCMENTLAAARGPVERFCEQENEPFRGIEPETLEVVCSEDGKRLDATLLCRCPVHGEELAVVLRNGYLEEVRWNTPQEESAPGEIDGRIFQALFDELDPALPDEWKTVIFRGYIDRSSYTYKYFVDFGDGTYIGCYDIPESLGVQEDEVDKAFKRIDRILRPIWKSLPPKHQWSAITMTIHEDCTFHVDFDYTVLGDNEIDYIIGWEKKLRGLE